MPSTRSHTFALAHRPSHVPNGGTTRFFFGQFTFSPLKRRTNVSSAMSATSPSLGARWLMANKHAQHAQVTSGDRGAFDRPFASVSSMTDARKTDVVSLNLIMSGYKRRNTHTSAWPSFSRCGWRGRL